MPGPDHLTGPADPFGLWTIEEPVSTAAGEMTSFGLPAGEGADEAAEVAVWRLDLTSGPDGQAAAQQELDRRAGQVQGIFTGLEQAVPRTEALLNARASSGAPGVSFGVENRPAAENLPEPEAWLAEMLNQVEATPGPQAPAGDEVSFGLGQDLANLAGSLKDKLTGSPAEASSIPGWEDLQRNFDQMMERVNRQLLHFCWVETTLDGHLAARTTVGWGGDMATTWQIGLLPDQAAAHRRSLELAMQSRAASLKTVMTVAQVAGKLTLAVTTPLGPLQAAQALVLGWKFVSSVVMPLLKQA